MWIRSPAQQHPCSSLTPTASKTQLSKRADRLHAIRHHQMLSVLKPEPHRRQPWSSRHPAPTWALSLLCSPLPEGFCPGFLSSYLLPHTSPAAPPIGLLDLWHATNCSKLSFPQCIPSVRQCFNKAILCKTNVLKKPITRKKLQGGWERKRQPAGLSICPDCGAHRVSLT